VKKIKKKKRLSEKTGFDPIANADSVWSRASASRKSGKSGKDLQQILNIEDDGPDRRLHTSEPLKMMDLVLQDWEGDQANGDDPAEDETDEEESGMEIDDRDDDEEEDE
jgi:hypothetical protein